MRYILALSILLIPGLGRAGDSWLQFRGPDGQGHADGTNLPVEWSESQNIAWKVPLPGLGWSSPVIADEQIWLTAALDNGKNLHALCVHRDTGAILHDIHVFSVDAPEKINAKNSYASPTPVIEGGRVWIHFGTYGTACLSRQSGQVLWAHKLLQLDHKEGPGSSPILVGNFLVVHCDGMDVQYVAALDKNTGELAWKAERSGPKHPEPDQRKAYSTPLLIEAAGRRQLISVGAGRASSYDPLTGAELWFVDFDGFSNVPRPVFADGLVILDTGYMKPQMWGIRPTGDGNVTDSHVVWRVKAQVPANPSPVTADELFYMVSDQGVMSCLEIATGKERYKSRLGGNFSASPIVAGGRVYFCSEEGLTTVFAVGPKLRELSKNQLDGRLLASPAVVGRAMYLRTDTHLYRVEQLPAGGDAAR